MLRLVAFLIVSILFSACGVESSSTANNAIANIGNGDSDTNGTDDPTDPVDPTDPNASTETLFDTDGAIEDKFACITGDVNNGYTDKTISDTSNDYYASTDEEYGIGIISNYPYSSDAVFVFYNTLKPSRTNQWKNVSSSGDKYTLSVDTGWADNDVTKIYVRTPKDSNDLYGCYRYELELISEGNVTVTIVFRYEIQ